MKVSKVLEMSRAICDEVGINVDFDKKLVKKLTLINQNKGLVDSKEKESLKNEIKNRFNAIEKMDKDELKELETIISNDLSEKEYYRSIISTLLEVGLERNAGRPEKIYG